MLSIEKVTISALTAVIGNYPPNGAQRGEYPPVLAPLLEGGPDQFAFKYRELSTFVGN
jgi:hypothetical protein